MFPWRLFEQRAFPLLPVQRSEHLVGPLGVVGEQIARQPGLEISSTVPVDDASPERRVVSTVTIRADRQVVATHLPLELARSGLAENGHVIATDATPVIQHLSLEPLVPIAATHALENFVDDTLLLGVKKLADRRLGDRPGCGDPATHTHARKGNR